MRLLHFSDAHLGAEIHGRRDTDGRHTQLKDFLRCLDFVVQTAVDEKVDAVLFTGDAYHSTRPDPLSQREFLRRIFALSERGISVLLLMGNHDSPIGYGEASALDIVNLFKIPGLQFVREPKVVTLRTLKGELQVACLPYLPRRYFIAPDEERGWTEERVQQEMLRRVSALVNRLQREARQNSDDCPVIFAGHIWVQGANFVGSERIFSLTYEPVVSPSDLRREPFAYIALGHIHRYQRVGEMTPPIVYAGNLARLDFSEEGDPKGFLLVDLEQTTKGTWGVKDLRFMETPTRPFVTVRLDLSKASDPTQHALNALAQDKRLDGAVVRVFFTISETQRGQLNLATIRAALEKRVDHLAALSFEVATDDSILTPLLADPHRPFELEELLQKPMELLARWLNQKGIPDERKERLLRLARELMEGQ
jgi:exonuclease SbcD